MKKSKNMKNLPAWYRYEMGYTNILVEHLVKAGENYLIIKII